MGIAASIILIAVGAILAWGVNAAVPHADLRVIGVILMVVGAIGLIASVAIELPRRRVRETYVRQGDAPDEQISSRSPHTSYSERVSEERDAY